MNSSSPQSTAPETPSQSPENLATQDFLDFQELDAQAKTLNSISNLELKNAPKDMDTKAEISAKMYTTQKENLRKLVDEKREIHEKIPNPLADKLPEISKVSEFAKADAESQNEEMKALSIGSVMALVQLTEKLSIAERKAFFSQLKTNPSAVFSGKGILGILTPDEQKSLEIVQKIFTEQTLPENSVGKMVQNSWGAMVGMVAQTMDIADKIPSDTKFFSNIPNASADSSPSLPEISQLQNTKPFFEILGEDISKFGTNVIKGGKEFVNGLQDNKSGAAVGIGAVALLGYGLYKLFSGESSSENSKEGGSWWKKGLALGAIGLAGYLGLKNMDWLKKLLPEGEDLLKKGKDAVVKAGSQALDAAGKAVESTVDSGLDYLDTAIDFSGNKKQLIDYLKSNGYEIPEWINNLSLEEIGKTLGINGKEEIKAILGGAAGMTAFTLIISRFLGKKAGGLALLSSGVYLFFLRNGKDSIGSTIFATALQNAEGEKQKIINRISDKYPKISFLLEEWTPHLGNISEWIGDFAEYGKNNPVKAIGSVWIAKTLVMVLIKKVIPKILKIGLSHPLITAIGGTTLYIKRKTIIDSLLEIVFDTNTKKGQSQIQKYQKEFYKKLSIDSYKKTEFSPAEKRLRDNFAIQSGINVKIISGLWNMKYEDLRNGLLLDSFFKNLSGLTLKEANILRKYLKEKETDFHFDDTKKIHEILSQIISKQVDTSIPKSPKKSHAEEIASNTFGTVINLLVALQEAKILPEKSKTIEMINNGDELLDIDFISALAQDGLSIAWNGTSLLITNPSIVGEYLIWPTTGHFMDSILEGVQGNWMEAMQEYGTAVAPWAIIGGTAGGFKGLLTPGKSAIAGAVRGSIKGATLPVQLLKATAKGASIVGRIAFPTSRKLLVATEKAKIVSTVGQVKVGLARVNSVVNSSWMREMFNSLQSTQGSALSIHKSEIIHFSQLQKQIAHIEDLAALKELRKSGSGKIHDEAIEALKQERDRIKGTLEKSLPPKDFAKMQKGIDADIKAIHSKQFVLYQKKTPPIWSANAPNETPLKPDNPRARAEFKTEVEKIAKKARLKAERTRILEQAGGKLLKSLGVVGTLYMITTIADAQNPYSEVTKNSVVASLFTLGAKVPGGVYGKAIGVATAAIVTIFWGEEGAKYIDQKFKEIEKGIDKKGYSKTYVEGEKLLGGISTVMSGGLGDIYDLTVGEIAKGENAYTYFSDRNTGLNYANGFYEYFHRDNNDIESWNIDIKDKQVRLLIEENKYKERFSSASREVKNQIISLYGQNPEISKIIKNLKSLNEEDDSLYLLKYAYLKWHDLKVHRETLESQKISENGIWIKNQAGKMMNDFINLQNMEKNGQGNTVGYYHFLHSFVIQFRTLTNMHLLDNVIQSINNSFPDDKRKGMEFSGNIFHLISKISSPEMKGKIPEETAELLGA